MIHLGIDFGTQKIGLALSDSAGLIAFPHTVIPRSGAAAYIAALVLEKKVGKVVIGDTKGYGAETNTTEDALALFLDELQAHGVEAVLSDEAGTSGAARAGLGEGGVRGTVQSPRRDTRVVDAHAAALILQRYLDTHKA